MSQCVTAVSGWVLRLPRFAFFCLKTADEREVMRNFVPIIFLIFPN